MSADDQKPSLRGAAVTFGNVGGIGCAIPALVIGAILLGRWLDRSLGTEPWILLGLLVGSIVLGVALMVASGLAAAQAAYRDYLEHSQRADRQRR